MLNNYLISGLPKRLFKLLVLAVVANTSPYALGKMCKSTVMYNPGAKPLEKM